MFGVYISEEFISKYNVSNSRLSSKILYLSELKCKVLIRLMERNIRALQVAVRCYGSIAFRIKLDLSTRADKTFQIVHFLAFNKSANVSKIIHLL